MISRRVPGQPTTFAISRLPLQPDQFPTHRGLIEQLLFNPRGGAKEREECDRVGKLLRAWSRDGEKGRLFDGVSNIRIDDRVAHFELGQIPEHATEMRAAANFLVANYGRQKIITMPRSVPKIAIFEEAARTLEIPGGVRMIQEYYRQMRKFGCNILAVVQQYDVLRSSEARGAIIGNSKMFLNKSHTIRYCSVQRIVYSYTRFSTPRQEEGDSERRQIEAARQYAAENAFILDESIGVDRGKSAWTGANIADGALGAFIKRIEAHQIPKGSVLIVESPDRISRQTFSEAYPTYQRILNAGIKVIFQEFVKYLDHIIHSPTFCALE